MRIKITESEEIKELEIINPKTGIDYINDFLIKHGGFESIKFSETEDMYVTDQENFSRWDDIIKRYQEVDDRYFNVKQELPWEKSEEMEQQVANVAGDLEDYLVHLNTICDEYEKFRDRRYRR